MDNEKKKKIIDRGKREKLDFENGALEGGMGYRFQTRAMLEVLFLYINGVDVGNPDLLGTSNMNTFVNDAKQYVEKIKEQIRLDIKDLNFMVSGGSTLGRFIPKAANRKMLEDNDFADTLDYVPDNAADYGSGFLKTWLEEGKMLTRSVDPFDIIFNQYNFKEGLKQERVRHSIRWVVDNEKYDEDARTKLRLETDEDKLDDDMTYYQVVEDLKDGSQTITMIDYDREEVYYHFESKEKIVNYFKFDFEKRKGFPDALGIGNYEKVFNKLVQGKVNRERLDKVLQIAATMPFQKKMDNERDNYAGKQVLKLKTSAVIGYKENPISVMDTGGVKQAGMINAELASIINTVGGDLNVGEALAGNTLPSGTSGELGNLLTENSSSVLKDVKKNYAKFMNIVYKIAFTPYILSIFSDTDNLKEYLDPNDIKIIERNVVNFLVIQKQIDAAINNEPFDPGAAAEEVKREIKNKPLISGELLTTLRNEVTGIRTFISGEKTSKAQTVAFLQRLQKTYVEKPELFKDPFFIETLKKEAELSSGVSGIEIDNLIREIA